MAQLMGYECGTTQRTTRYAKDRNAIEMKAVIDRLEFPAIFGIGTFDVPAAMTAIKYALRQKHAVRRPSARV